MKRARPGRKARPTGAITPRRSLGQHFLHNEDLLAFMVELAGVVPSDLVLEVGPGPGNLTRRLLDTGARVLAVELDERFSATVPDALGRPANLRWLEGDVLRGKNAWNPHVVAAVEEELSSHAPLKLIANLPYSVAVPVLALLVSSPWPITLAVFMVQQEVAQRIVAPPGNKHYGPISVLVSLAGVARIRKRVGRGSFSPPPRVDSAMVEIQFAPGRSGPELEAVLATCRRLFPYRRKTLRAALRAAFKGTIGAAQADQFAQRFGLDRRLETMTPGGFVELRQVLAEAGVEPVG